MTPYLTAALFFVLGLGVGVLFFSALRQTTRMIVEGGSFWRIGLLYVVRFAAIGGVLYWAARTGAIELLASAAGFTVARVIVIRLSRAR